MYLRKGYLAIKKVLTFELKRPAQGVPAQGILLNRYKRGPHLYILALAMSKVWCSFPQERLTATFIKLGYYSLEGVKRANMLSLPQGAGGSWGAEVGACRARRLWPSRGVCLCCAKQVPRIAIAESGGLAAKGMGFKSLILHPARGFTVLHE